MGMERNHSFSYETLTNYQIFGVSENYIEKKKTYAEQLCRRLPINSIALGKKNINLLLQAMYSTHNVNDCWSRLLPTNNF